MRQAAAHFGIGITTLVRWRDRIDPIPTKKRIPKIDLELLKKDVEMHPDAYQYERAQRLGVSASFVWQYLHRLGYTVKKNFKKSQSRA